MKSFIVGFILAATATSAFAEGEKAYARKFKLHGVTFDVTSPNMGAMNKLNIVIDGLKRKTAPIVREIEGTVTGAEVADLNSDGSPEVFVYVTSAGSGSYGSLVALAANNKKSLSDIYLPDISADKNLSEGYMGHDEFSVVENVLGRRFPVYKPGDANAKPTGGVRQISYELVPGEAGWVLRVKRVDNF